MTKNKKNQVSRPASQKLQRSKQTPSEPKIIVIIGPTASGKSALALRLARLVQGKPFKKIGINGAEIVSADSRQVYCGMDIGTAKPVKKELESAKHHLINIKNPDQEYSVAEFKKDAIGAINKIIKNRKLPILVGGTGLYVDAIVKNLDIPEVKEDKKLRANLEKEIKAKGLDYVFKKLVAIDPEAAYVVDPKNPRRIIRALEVALTTGRPFTSQRQAGKSLFNALQIGIRQSPEVLKKRIKKRTSQMIRDGLVDEVNKLIKKYGPKQKAFDAIGYREIIDYLRDKTTLEEAADLINKNTWHYARRQITWFKRNPKIEWVMEFGKAIQLVKAFIS